MADVRGELRRVRAKLVLFSLEQARAVNYDLQAVRKAMKVAAELAEQDSPVTLEALRPLVEEVRAIAQPGAAP